METILESSLKSINETSLRGGTTKQSVPVNGLSSQNQQIATAFQRT